MRRFLFFFAFSRVSGVSIGDIGDSKKRSHYNVLSDYPWRGALVTTLVTALVTAQFAPVMLACFSDFPTPGAGPQRPPRSLAGYRGVRRECRSF